MEKLEKNNQSKSDLQTERETEENQAGTESRDITNTFTTPTQGENEQTSAACAGHRLSGPTDSKKFSNSETSQGGSVQPDKTDHGEDNPVRTGAGNDSNERKSLYSAVVKRKISPPQSPSSQLTPIGFYLLIFGDYCVDKATLKLDDSKLIPMNRVKDHACDNNLFKCIVPLPWAQIKDNLTYKYGFCVKGQDFKLPIIGKIYMLSKQPEPHVEANTFQKQVRSQIQYDVFNFEGGSKYMSEAVPKSVVFYLKWLLNFIHPTTISALLTQIESLNFTSLVTLDKSHMEECVKWIVKQASEYSATDLRHLYLCIVLGHLCMNSDVLPYPRDGKTKEMCNRFLQILHTSFNSHLLPPQNLKALRNVASILVENSSSPGWLTLAAHFYPYLEIGFILGKKYHKYQKQTYECTEYEELVNMLLSRIEKIDSKEMKAHQDLLHLVMNKAPSLNDALLLFERSDVSLFFTNDEEKLDFFAEYYLDKVKDVKSAAARLIEFYIIPEKIRSTLHESLFQTLLEYIQSDDESNDNDEKVFLQSIISERDLDRNQVLEALKELSKSKSVRRQMLLRKILDNERFRRDWCVTDYEVKLDICESWVITRVVNKLRARNLGKDRDPVDKIVAVYSAIDDIMRCSLNISNKALANDISKHVVERLLKNEETASFLKASTGIEVCMYVVQECYKAHVKNMLKVLKRTQQKGLKKSSMILKEYSGCSLALDLLSCILEIMEVPEIGSNGKINENHFGKVLDSCDIWIVFLSISAMDEKSRKYRVGKKICQEIEKCIENGDVSVSFLKDVSKKKEDVSMLCATLQAKSTPSDNIDDLKTHVSDRISHLMLVAEDSSTKIEMLTLAIECSNKITKDVRSVPGMETVMETLNDLKRTLRTGTVKELEDKTSWGELLQCLSAAKQLNTVGNSLSFRTVAKNFLKELSRESADEHENEEIPVHDFYSLIVFLTTRAIEQFQEHWNPVLSEPELLNAETIKALFGILKDEDLLERELEMLEKYFGEKFSPDIKRYIHNYVKFPHLLEQVQRFIAICNIFGLVDIPNETMTVLLQFQAVMENTNQPTSLHQSMENIKQIVSIFSGEELVGVIKELSSSRELLGFIEEILDEDIRFLIDAVEEHSDQFVFESSVSDLIDVHGFLAPLIRKKQDKKLELQDFVNMLKESCIGHKDIIEGKIHQCSMNVNSLRGLYMSIANRGEMTKEIIRNCLNRGEYCVSHEDGKSETKMSYVLQGDGEDKSRVYSLSDLHDLRSRAHLIVSSRIKVTSSRYSESSEDVDFDEFINQVNLLTEITNHLSKLRSSGYVKYRRFWRRMKSTDELQTARDSLLEDQENWEDVLENVRERFYLLNYYRSDQLCKLYDFLIDEPGVDCDEVLSLIHFVDSTITKKQLKDHQTHLGVSNPNESPEILLSTVGEALESIFSKAQRVIRRIPGEKETHTYRKKSHQERFSSEAEVALGEIFVASLEPDSSIMVNVLLTLYENTSNAYPEPYQIVFCNAQTNWEDLHLLLQRCFMHSKFVDRKSLSCIANVELLPNELQFKLVKAIKEKQKYYESAEAIKENVDYQLALICCGGDHHHIVDQFAQYTHRIAGMSDYSLGQRLKSGWPDVKSITSKLPGLGKTEQVKRRSLDKGMGVVTFPISGPFEPSKVIQRLKGIKIKKYHCLHLDISEVSDPLLLETFLFQLIVTGMVSAGNQFYHLPTTHIYIEIANTLNDTLRESLIVLKYFNHNHLEWQNYDDFLVSSKKTSSVQVVCQYLDVFDRDGLDSNEILFSGQNTFEPLETSRCKQLLLKYFSSAADVTFTILHTFLGVLADQLLKFSKSTFFKIKNLESMVGEESTGVRSNLFSALLEVSKEFASRAITTSPSADKMNLSQEESARALDEAIASTGTSAEDMVERVTGMIQWENSNHLLVVFHGLNSQAITAVYRKRSSVPPNVIELLESQVVRGSTELDDMEFLTEDELQEKLEKIACMKLVGKNNLFSRYALTPDNILKMILIILRVRANVPVIIMGETGCGKTSLIRYLADTCGIEVNTFNLHAGRSEEETIIFIKEKEYEAKNTKEKMWIFLDEINTCDHLGLISDVICHHSLLGRPLAKNLVFLAACNPYKLRLEEHVKTAGLEGKNIADEYSKLVYRVHPLPEAMIDYVWDYGSLAPEDERNYIQRMLRDLPGQYEAMLVELLAASQKFVRGAERNHFCVSLRDVYRCIYLIEWFENMRKQRQNLKESEKEYPNYLQQCKEMSQRYKENPMIKSIVLGLAHCYLSRLPTAELRKDYRKCMMEVFSYHDAEMTVTGDWDTFAAIVRMEEEDYLDRMEIPHGTARNAALRENIFVMLVCILNRIPIFVVGKPGCSKSLSIQLIRSNLRGRDSQNDLFRKLPQLYVVSYQGSESSTSEGIVKVFEKARKYKSHNKDGNVLPVVLLDEVGLAENSKYNPLKVLHNLLEPGEGKFPDVAVVGISNWSLDAAKMNRAIHLSRPEPTREDLYDTGYSLHYADSTDASQLLGEEVLKSLADGYFEYEEQQHGNFHGLRDYYSLIKSLSGCSTFEEVNISLQRNFGGLYDEVTNIQKIFLDKLKRTLIKSSDEDIIPVTRLIEANLADAHARHLMLITRGDSAHGILKQIMANLNKESITILGSRFEEDLSEDYNYRILSRIILCMERDCVLILKDLESIYGSLYDLLNQNYAVVGKRKNCRVALGAYSNPMCQVHDGFRCIVLMDEQNVKDSDPPFLNRFEKQVLRFSDVLTEDQQKVISELRDWVHAMSTVEGLESHFCETDLFIGFHEDTLPSLVLSHRNESDMEEVSKRCKEDLMWVASPDGVLRAKKCDVLKENQPDIQEFSNEYFRKPLHEGLAVFMEYVMNNFQKSSFFGSDEIGSKTVIMTFSNIYTDIRQCLDNNPRSQVERLSAYKSEKQLAESINAFWNAPEKELLVLQCKPDLDAPHLLLARSIIEEKRDSYKQCSSGMDTYAPKHVCIVMHVQRVENEDVPWQFSFLCGWRQVFLDVLERPIVPLREILGESVQKLLTSSIWPIRKFTQNDLLWCFTCIKYTQSQRPLDSVSHIAKNLLSSSEVALAIERLILQSISSNALHKDQESHQKENWQVEVACDRQSLVNSSTLYGAMEQYVSRLVRNPLAKIVYFLEKENSWPPHLVHGCNEIRVQELEAMWCNFINKNAIFEISHISEPLGAECYILDTTSLDLCLPFSQVVVRKVDGAKELFLEEHATLMENDDSLDENGQLKVAIRQQQIEIFSKTLVNLVPELNLITCDYHNLYLKDVLAMVTADFSETLKTSERVSMVQAIFISEIERHLPAKDMPQFCALLHTFVWDHQEHILDSLRMVDCCRPFIGSNAPSNLKNMFQRSEEVIMIKANETSHSQEEMSTQADSGIKNHRSNDIPGTVETTGGETESAKWPFIGLDVLTNLTDEMLYGSEEPMTVTDDETFRSEEPTQENENRNDTFNEARESDSKSTHWPSMEPNFAIDDMFHSSKEIVYMTSDTDTDKISYEESPEVVSATNETERSHDSEANFQTDLEPDETEQSEMSDDDVKYPSQDFQHEHEYFNEMKNYEHSFEDQQQEVLEEIDYRQDSEKFGDILVTLYCKEMFPSQKVVEQNGGLESWIRNANLLLSSAFKISEHSPAFHYLRLCVDFARIISTSISLLTSLSSLYTLNEIGVSLEPEYLDHEDSFQTITEGLIQPLEEEMEDHRDKREALQRFSALFYGRCIDTNVDSCAVAPIIEQVLSLKESKLVMMMSPVVLRLLKVEEVQSPGIFMKLITDPSAVENSPCLQIIDSVFKEFYLNDLMHHDSYAAVMICDLIQSLMNFEDKFRIENIDSSESEELIIVKSATGLISNTRKTGGLATLSAVAFLRGFFTMLAEFVVQRPSILKEQSQYAHMIKEVNSILRGPKTSLQLFFLKQLQAKASLFDTEKWICESNTLLTLQEQWYNERSHNYKAVFTTVLKYPEYEEAKAAYWKLMSNDESCMKEFLERCQSSPNHAFALVGILINMVYLQRAVRKLPNKDEAPVNWFASNVGSFPKLLQELLIRVIGRRDFYCPELQLSPESSVEDVEMALLILHIACVVATNQQTENSLFYNYFTNPAKFKKMHPLAHCEDELRSVFDYLPYDKEFAGVTCSCGLRLAFKSNVKEKVCPHCHAAHSDKTRRNTSPETYAKLPLSSHGETIPEWALCTKHMRPAVYRALHLIIYSSYYAGIALQTSTGDDLSSVLNILRGTDPVSKPRNPASICFETIKSDFSHLTEILSCKKIIAIKTINLVVEKTSDLIKSNNLQGANDCSTPTMCREWEDEFSKRAEEVFLKPRETSMEIKKMMKLPRADDSQAKITLECLILELDNYPEVAEEQNKQLKRLFRMTKQLSFEDFRSAFLHSPEEVQSKHSFLASFFAKFDQLSMIGNLYHLLKWSRLVSSALTHRISRKDAHSKSIDDFIRGDIVEINRTPQEMKCLKVLFNKFKEAWNFMRDLVNKLPIDKKEMPRLRQTDCVAYCLLEGDCRDFLKTAIEILVCHQNSILDAVISISSHLHPALSFLQKENCSGVMSASIQHVKEKEIINFQWSDDFFQDAQRNPEYGKGQEITYDFERIEMGLANKIVFGKSFLTGTLDKFIFAKELFHSCGPLLTEIRSQLEQDQSLPDDVCKGVSNLKERGIKEAQNLLQHCEVLIFLLKQKLMGINVDMTLEEFAEKMSPLLPSPFPVKLLPQPRRLIKIRHLLALYEALEDVLADGAVEGLADKFREALPSDMKESVNAMKMINQLKPSNFLKALRRFVFRYLSSETEKYWPEERKSLQSCLEEPSLWFPLQPPKPNDIPQEITLEYVHSIVKHLEAEEKEKKSEWRKTSVRSFSSKQQNIKQASGRRRITKFAFA